MTPKISILVPIYKVEAYLQRCINSVLAQNFTDWEMILVDDGSPDKCPQIADVAASKEERIKVIHKENGGLISARREGVRHAKGEYYMFLDSDDWLESDALSVLYHHISSGDYDMVKAGGQRVDSEGRVCPLERYAFEEGEIIYTVDFLVKMYTGKVAPYLWGALYKGRLFDDDVFNESIENKISLGEDVVTNLIVGMRFKKVLYVKDVVYNYFFNPTSIMSSSAVTDSYGKRMEAFLYKKVFSYYAELQEWQQARLASYTFRNSCSPDVGFSPDYDKHVKILRNPRYSAKVRECVEAKYLRFATCKPLYRLYTWLFRTAYTIKKGKRIIKKELK